MEVIKKIRHDFRLTQQQLADKIGVSKSAISLIEAGTNKASLGILKKISAEFSIDLLELINDVPADRDYSKPQNIAAESVIRYGKPLEARVATLEKEIVEVKSTLIEVVPVVNTHSAVIIQLQQRMMEQAPDPVIDPEELKKFFTNPESSKYDLILKKRPNSPQKEAT